MDQHTGWKNILGAHLRRYPQMTVEDVYKLLYQGISGPEHSIPSADIFEARLLDELAAIQPDSGEPLFEEIRPDGGLLRIHLRPWLALEQPPAVLVEACLETGKHAWGTKQDLIDCWRSWFLNELEMDSFPTLQTQEAKELDRLLIEHSYPALHHSEQYEKLYRPAYRLVSRDFTQRISGRSADRP